MRVFFATDIHGSEKCWKKFVNAGKFYNAQVLILGGDMTGKAIVPFIKQSPNKYKVTFMEQQMILTNNEQVNEMLQAIKDRGYYPIILEPEEVDYYEANPEKVEERFAEEALNTIKGWLEWAEDRLSRDGMKCYVCPGNDDMFEIDELINQSTNVISGEGRLLDVGDGYKLLSTGWSNPTPWHTHRECSEEELKAKLEGLFGKIGDTGKIICNFHCPPYGMGLDEAPELDENMRPKFAGRSLIPVGSKSVYEAIVKYQPAAGLFGHVHEGRAAVRKGRTICINPGSNYEQGVLLGAIVDFGKDGVENYLLTTG